MSQISVVFLNRFVQELLLYLAKLAPPAEEAAPVRDVGDLLWGLLLCLISVLPRIYFISEHAYVRIRF